jgi:integrating conjugative element protein (TIGR03759 family)
VQAGSTTLDAADRASAQYWGLSVEDYRRYQLLMKGVRGAVSDPRISPIEVLGIHARSDAERRRYAEMFARLMVDDAQRLLQFQTEYEHAVHRLYPRLVALDLGAAAHPPGGLQPALVSAPQQPIVSAQPQDTGALAPAAFSTPPAVSAGDRLLVFARDGCPPCDFAVDRALAHARAGIAVDLYVVGARSADEVQRLARRLGVEPALVGSGRVTLNLDRGTYARVLPGAPALPAVVRKRGDSFDTLREGEL